MSHKNSRVAVVAPVFNRREITLQCLRSLARVAQTNIELDIVIVDDGSTDGTTSAINSEFPYVDVVQGTGDLWFTGGTNVGVRRALERDPDYVLMINDDQVFDARAIEYMVETAGRNPKRVVGPLLLLWDRPHILLQVAPVWSTWLGTWRHWSRQTIWTIPKKPWRVDLIVGNCVLVPAEAFRKHGLMNSKRYPNFGDAEFTPRLKRAGWELLIDPRARVFCQPNTPPPSVRKLTLPQTFNDLVLDLRKPQNLRRRFYGYWDGAPSKTAGFVGFIVFVMRVLIGKNPETAAWANSHVEPPLSEVFAASVVDD
jgi:GT2 family glycosyltransferase